METWKEYRFNELFNWCSGKPFLNEGSKYPVYGSNGIIGCSDISNFENRIILGRVGAYCGSVNYYDKSFYATDNTLVTECDESKITYKYAYYLLTQSKLNSFAGGAAQPLITQSILKHLKCVIPPLHTQQKIASILSTYDNLIQNYKKQIEDLQTCASELYKEWFVRFRFPGYQTTQFENGIPVGWNIMRLNSVATLINGRAYLMPELLSEGKYRIVRVGNFSGKDEWFYSNMELEEDKYCEKGDLLYKWACNFGPEIWNEEKVIYHYHIWKIKVNEEIMNKSFLFYYLKFNTPLWLGGTNGATMVHITKESMEKKKILVPSAKVLDKFDFTVNEIIRRMDLLQQQINNLTQQRDLLLPRLMSGKLEVK